MNMFAPIKPPDSYYITERLRMRIAENDLAFRLEIESALTYYYESYQKVKILSENQIATFYNLIDELIEGISPIDKAALQCKKGCSFCCHYNVDVSEDEAAYIAKLCKAQNITINKKYLKKQLRVTPADFSTSPVSACVFLKNNLCSIYAARPLNCRKYYVFTNPLLCKPDSKVQVGSCFSALIECLISAVHTSSTVHRLPQAMLPYSR